MKLEKFKGKYTIFETDPSPDTEHDMKVDKSKFKIKESKGAWTLEDKQALSSWEPDKIPLFPQPESNEDRFYGLVNIKEETHLLKIRKHPKCGKKDNEIELRLIGLKPSPSPNGSGGGRR
jgi:hypothetical protein